MRTIGRHGKDPPSGWLFHVRWQDGGLCPETGKPLRRETIGEEQVVGPLLYNANLGCKCFGQLQGFPLV